MMERRNNRDEPTSDRSRGIRSSSSRYIYHARSAEDVRKRASESSKDFDTYLRDTIKLYKPADGANTIRILPPTWDNPKHFAYDLHVHYGVGPDEQAYLCLNKMKGEPCPVCEELQRARRDRESESEEYIKSLEPTRRSLFYLVDRDNEKEGVQAWAAPFSRIDQAIVKVSIDRRTNEVLSIDDPDEGYDIEFERGGKGIGTQYSGVAIARRSSPLGKNEWLDFAVDNPLPDVLEFYSYDHIQKVFGGGSPRRDEGSRSERELSSHSNERGGRQSPQESQAETRRGLRHEVKAELTWDAVQALSGEKLDDVIEDEKLDLDPNKFDSDEDLRDAICEELKLDKPRAAREERGRGREEPTRDGGDKLAEMRRRRE